MLEETKELAQYLNKDELLQLKKWIDSKLSNLSERERLIKELWPKR